MLSERIVAACQVTRGKKIVATSLLVVTPWNAALHVDVKGIENRDRVLLTRDGDRASFNPEIIKNLTLSSARAGIAPGIVNRFEATIVENSAQALGGEAVACYRALSRPDAAPMGQMYLVIQSDAGGFKVGPLHAAPAGRTSNALFRSHEEHRFEWAEPPQNVPSLEKAEAVAAQLAHDDAYSKFKAPMVRFGCEGTAEFDAIIASAPDLAAKKVRLADIGAYDGLPTEWQDLEWIDEGVGRLWNDRDQGILLTPALNQEMPVEHLRASRWYRAGDHAAAVIEAFADRFPNSFPESVLLASKLFLHGASGLSVSGPTESVAPAETMS